VFVSEADGHGWLRTDDQRNSTTIKIVSRRFIKRTDDSITASKKSAKEFDDAQHGLLT